MQSSSVPSLPVDIATDIAAIARIEAVPTMLRVLCETTGMGFAAVARVTEGRWVACAVQDDIRFGLVPGGELDVDTSLCEEVRLSREPIVIEHASIDPVDRGHRTPRLDGIESYLSVPIVLPSGEYFGTLCAMDPRPAELRAPRILAMVQLFAQLIGLELETERRRDVSDRALLDERRAGEAREQFIAVLGHDLRNPLAAISACGQLIERRPGHPEIVANAAARITTNVRRMSALIADMLDLARGRLGGGLDVSLDVVADLGAALAAVVAESSDAWPGRVIDSRIDIAAPVRADVGRLQQLASNLLGNALDHGAHDQPIEFVARLRGASLSIEVVHAGTPIDASDVAKRFEPFWRQSTATRGQGLGLGLYISDQIVRAHGGRLDVVVDADGRTRFTATLPLARGPAD